MADEWSWPEGREPQNDREKIARAFDIPPDVVGLKADTVERVCASCHGITWTRAPGVQSGYCWLSAAAIRFIGPKVVSPACVSPPAAKRMGRVSRAGIVRYR